MIDDALRFMRAEGQQVRITQTDIAVLCSTICNEWADQGHVVSYAGPRELTIDCDADLMVRILNNVIGNAVTYADGARVCLEQRSANIIQISVADTGLGIPAALHPTVLEPFSRLKSVEAGGKGSVKGFGLGLAISRELTERQGGHLRLASNDPQGLIVLLELPLSATVIA